MFFKKVPTFFKKDPMYFSRLVSKKSR